MKNFQDEQKRLRARDHQITEDRVTAESIATFMRAHREVIDNLANVDVIRSYFNGEEIRAAQLEDAYANHEEFRNSLSYQTEEEERVRLFNRIIELLTGTMSEQGLEAEKKFIRVKSTEEMRNKVAELERRREFSKQSASEVWVQAMTDAGCTVQLPSDWKTLTPAELRVRAKVIRPSTYQPVPAIWRTKSMMETLSATELRNLVRLCGLDQVNAVLAQTPAQEAEAARGEE